MLQRGQADLPVQGEVREGWQGRWAWAKLACSFLTLPSEMPTSFLAGLGAPPARMGGRWLCPFLA